MRISFLPLLLLHLKSFLPLVLLHLATPASSVSVQTESGAVSGRPGHFHGLRRNGTHFSFEGIPYAASPVGPLRFKDPLPVEPWSGILDATSGPPSSCLQKMAGVVSGDEDCLTLSVFTPEVPNVLLQHDSALRPVVVWIHGGFFTFGSGAFGQPDLFLEADVVYVSINYRLGVFGFMAIEGTDIQGNMGLKDQLEALRWVKKNIAKFGGDPSRITIFGGSAGGASVHSHVLSPLAKDENLFQRAVAMSGTAMLVDPDKANEFVERSSRRSYELLCGVNLTLNEAPENLTETCLYELDAREITDKLFDLYLNRMRNLTVEESLSDKYLDNLLFFPILDPWADVPFQPEHPVTVVTSQQQKMVPFMSGVTKDEGALLLAPLWKDMKPGANLLQEHWKQIGPILLYNVLDKGSRTEEDELYAEMIARYYAGKNGVARDNKQDLLDMFSDQFFVMANEEFVRLHAEAAAPVYNYQFSYRGSFSFSSIFSLGDKEALQEDFGVSHLDDRVFFRYGSIPNLVSDKDVKVAEIFVKLLTNFAKYGDPTPIAYKDVPNWPKVQTDASVYFDINEAPQAKRALHEDRMTFRNKIYFSSVLERYAVPDDDELQDELEELSPIEMDDEIDDYDMEAGVAVNVEDIEGGNGSPCNCKKKFRQIMKKKRAKKRFGRRGRKGQWRKRRGRKNKRNKLINAPNKNKINKGKRH